MEDKQIKKVESTGNTVEEAIQEGINELGVARDKVSIKIVCEEQKGLFGMGGAKPAKVIVSVKE